LTANYVSNILFGALLLEMSPTLDTSESWIRAGIITLIVRYIKEPITSLAA